MAINGNTTREPVRGLPGCFPECRNLGYAVLHVTGCPHSPNKPLCDRSQPFVAVGRAVMRGAEHIAQAVSGTFAKRIANALNNHVPDRRGQ